jgi:putative transposase
VADGLVYHAINRGNNRDRVFFDDADFRAFLKALGQTQLRYPFELYAYVLMSNHFHLVLRPAAGQSISRILQSLTVAHTWRYHRRHRSVGHVWQGRFRSPVVQDDAHLLTLLRYVEGNPLRAGMVADLADYPWSSYPAHGLGRADGLLTEAPVWAGVGADEAAGQAYWRGWVHERLSARELEAVRRSVTTGRPYGEEAWAKGLGQQLGLPLLPKRRGRPPKQPGLFVEPEEPEK